MRRLACAVMALGCQTVYAPFQGNPDGGVHGGTTVIGGMTSMDLAVPRDLGLGVRANGSIRVRSGAQSRLSATFSDGSCSVTAVAGCLLRDCVPADLSVAGVAINVGTIHAVTASADLLMSPGSDGLYVPVTHSGPLWPQTGGSVAVSGSGGDFPAFSTNLDGPTAVTVTNPLAGALDVPRSGDFTLTWSDGTTGHVTVELTNASQTLSCDFALAAGSGVISHNALLSLDAGAATLAVFAANTTLVDTVVEVRAEVSGRDVGGMDFAANVNLR